MQYNPDDSTKFAATENGRYDFTVVNARDTISNNNNEMIELELQLDVGQSKPLTIYDNLVNSPNSLWRIEEFCNAVGLDFKTGNLDANACIGRVGHADIVLGEPRTKGKNVGKRFMEVDVYVPLEGFAEQPGAESESKPQSIQSPRQQPPDDDIPF